jgi:glycosyltransferase involved in cell wall biosynthesis
MLANFAPFKRHWKFFEAVSQMPEGITAEVIGSPIDSRTLDDVVREARMFGVADRVTFRVNPPRPEITSALARSRVFCAMSLVEGSYVAAVEAMMSDTPVAMFANARVGSRAYVNAETGRLLDPGAAIGPQLLEMLSNQAQFRPAQWARQNVSAAVKCRLFNEALRETAEGRWTADIRNFYQRRQMKLYFGGDQEEQELRGEYENLRRLYGIDMRRLPKYPDVPGPSPQ